MTWILARFLPANELTGLPHGRPKRPNRRDHGGYTGNVDTAPWSAAARALLVQFGFPEESTKDLLYEIGDALSFREHKPAGPLRGSEEREDLAELYVRIGDVLDSLHAMSYQTRDRILDALQVAGLRPDPYMQERPLSQSQWGVGKALLELGTDVGGRPPYDDARETPFLATLIGIWLDQFPEDAGVRRRGDYAEVRRAKFEGRLLDFLVAMYGAVQIEAGSRAVIGKRAFQLQRRIRNDRAKAAGLKTQAPEAQ